MLNRIRLPIIDGLTLVREWRDTDLLARIELFSDSGIQNFVSKAPSSMLKAESQLAEEIRSTETEKRTGLRYVCPPRVALSVCVE